MSTDQPSSYATKHYLQLLQLQPFSLRTLCLILSLTFSSLELFFFQHSKMPLHLCSILEPNELLYSYHTWPVFPQFGLQGTGTIPRLSIRQFFGISFLEVGPKFHKHIFHYRRRQTHSCLRYCGSSNQGLPRIWFDLPNLRRKKHILNASTLNYSKYTCFWSSNN